jgi:hypothetical protein
MPLLLWRTCSRVTNTPKTAYWDTCSAAAISRSAWCQVLRHTRPCLHDNNCCATGHPAGLLMGRSEWATCNPSDTLSGGNSQKNATPTFICDAVATQRDHLDALVAPQELPNSSTACTTRQHTCASTVYSYSAPNQTVSVGV